MLASKNRLRNSLDPSPRRTTFITAHESKYAKLPPIRTSDLIAKDVEDFLAQELATAASDKAVFASHQAALDLLIVKLRSEGKPLKMMKDGYDSLIAELAEEARTHDKKRLQKTRSILLMSQYADEEKGNVASKMEKLLAHIQLVRNLTEELTDETKKLQGDVRTLKRENADRDLMVRVKGSRAADLNSELESVNARNEQINETIARKKQKIEDLKRKLEGELEGTNDVLGGVYALSGEIGKRRQEIKALESEMDEIQRQIACAQGEEESVQRQLSAVADELRVVQDEEVSIERENEALARAIAKASVC